VAGGPSSGLLEPAVAHSSNTPGPPQDARQEEVQATSPADPPPPGRGQTISPEKWGSVSGLRSSGTGPTPARHTHGSAEPNPSGPALEFRPGSSLKSPRIVWSAGRIRGQAPRSPEPQGCLGSPLHLREDGSQPPRSTGSGVFVTGGSSPSRLPLDLEETPVDLGGSQNPCAAEGGVLVTGVIGLSGPLFSLAETPADLAPPEVRQSPRPASGSWKGPSGRILGEEDETCVSQPGAAQVRNSTFGATGCTWSFGDFLGR